jgi:hypothetical protein
MGGSHLADEVFQLFILERSFIGRRKFITHDFIGWSFLIDQRNFILEIFIVRGVLIGRRNFIWKNNFVRSEGDVSGSAFSGERSFSIGSSMLGKQNRFWG